MFAITFLKFKSFMFAAASCPLPGTGTRGFFGFPHWWKYLGGEVDPVGKCSPVFNFPSSILPVSLAIVDMLLRLAGIIAVVSVIIAGITYITAAGSVDKAVGARKRIINALLGLAIVLIATAVVTFIGNSLK